MDFSILVEYIPLFITGIKITIGISFVSVILGFLLGLFICLGKISNNKVASVFSSIYIEVFRDTPLLVQLVLIYYGLPEFGIVFPSFFGLSDAFTAGVVGLSLNSAAYIAEILRSGIQAVDKGQMEASRSVGFNYWQSMRYIIVPQAVKNILPALANEFVTLVKESSIVSYITIADLMFVATSVKNATYDPFTPYVAVALIYFTITFSLSKLIAFMEKKMSVSN